RRRSRSAVRCACGALHVPHQLCGAAIALLAWRPLATGGWQQTVILLLCALLNAVASCRPTAGAYAWTMRRGALAAAGASCNWYPVAANGLASASWPLAAPLDCLLRHGHQSKERVSHVARASSDVVDDAAQCIEARNPT